LAAFVVSKVGGVPQNRNTVTIPTTAHIWQALSGQKVYGPLVGRGHDLATKARAFHWPLEFPDIIVAGGFDAVLGNPPWERVKLQEQEFFASRAPEIAEAPNTAERGRLIQRIKEAEAGTRDRAVYDEFEVASRTSEASSVFARVPGEDGGRFPLTGRGDVNTYALFAELFSRLASRRGRAGVVVPTGIATDATTAPFFSDLVANNRLFSLHDFQTGMGFFDRIGHARFKFCLMTLGAAGSAPEDICFSFFSRTPEDFSNPTRHFTLSAKEIAAINPNTNTNTVPVFRTSTDAGLTAKIYARVPVLIDEAKRQDGNPWGLSFSAMLHMSNDSGLFRTAAQLVTEGYERAGADWDKLGGAAPRQKALQLIGGRDGFSLDLQGGTVHECGRYVPLYEAKMVHQFDHRWATYDGTHSRDANDAEKRNVSFEAEPRYWVPESEVTERLAAKNWMRGWLMGWRDICRSTDERTVIVSIVPRSAVGHTSPLMFIDKDPIYWPAFLANLNSLTLDYVARQAVGGTHLTYGYLKQFAVLPPSAYSDGDLSFVRNRVLELTFSSHAMAPFARDLGYDGPPFAWDEDRRALLRAELDAFYARAYGLTRDELRYILDPTDMRGADYPSETFRVLKNNEIRKYGDYRTGRLVLRAWDRMQTGDLS
jgi:hypothetical protein